MLQFLNVDFYLKNETYVVGPYFPSFSCLDSDNTQKLLQQAACDFLKIDKISSKLIEMTRRVVV